MARAVVLQAEARSLPLEDASVDLIVTSPPYFGLRSYEDGGKPLAGQIGCEETPREYLDNLLACTAEWMRVLKPGGSLFVNLGDKYSGHLGAKWGNGRSFDGVRGESKVPQGGPRSAPDLFGVPAKSLMGLPWRYAIRCVDELGLTQRQEIIWAKRNGLPESVRDRCRRSHEQLFHFTKQLRYYAAVDEIREPHVRSWQSGANGGRGGWNRGDDLNVGLPEAEPNPLGALPGDVWTIATEPLNLPDWLGVEHHAAFPTALIRPVILGWSPPAVFIACGQGRFPVSAAEFDRQGRTTNGPQSIARRFESPGRDVRAVRTTTVTGYACACTPYADYPERRQPTVTKGRALRVTGMRTHGNDWPERQPVREYQLEGWTPPPSRPAVVLDPCGGTGTTALTAVALGRTGISCDLGADYGRAARWRVNDPGERARARGEEKPPLAKRVREDLYGITGELDALLEPT